MNTQHATNVLQAPILSILVHVIQNSANLLPQHEDFKEKEPPSPTRAVAHIKTPHLYVYTLLTIVSLLQAHPFEGAHLEICWLLAQATLYYGLFNRISRTSSVRTDNLAETITTLGELSYFMVPISVSFVFLKWDDLSFAPEVALVAVLKACRMLAIFVLVRRLLYIAYKHL